MYWICRCRIHEIGGECDEDNNQRIDPSVPEGEILPSLQVCACFPPFRMAEGFGM